jgi:hypothetical protein
MIFCITGYYDVLLRSIHMQLMAAMRYFDCLESGMSPDQFEDLVRKVKLAFAPRLKTCTSVAALSAMTLGILYDASFYCILLRSRRTLLHFTVYYYALPACIYDELWDDSHTFRAQEAVTHGLDSVLLEHSLHYQLQQEYILEPTVRDSSPSGPGTNPVHYPWGSVSSLLMNSKGEEIIYRVEDDRDRIWARRLDWVVDQHLDRAEDAQNQLQRDYEAVLRQCKQARERKYYQATISYLNKQLGTARRAIWALLR